jgi:indoleamine 2,3-dioxygenase
MPIRKANGEPGLLHLGCLGEAVENTLPNLTDMISKYKEDQVVLTALYRDYSFLASAYLFEPCHHEALRTEGKNYGLGRPVLPAQISQPIVKVAELYVSLCFAVLMLYHFPRY